LEATVRHFAGYFVITLMFCLAWPRPLAVGGVLMVFAVLLEGLQALRRNGGRVQRSRGAGGDPD
jgi:hypothetical protein